MMEPELRRAWPQYRETHISVPEMIHDVRQEIINLIIERVKDRHNDEVGGQCLKHLQEADDHLYQAMKVLLEQSK